MVEMNRSERDREAVKATRIVDEASLTFQRWVEGMAMTPTIQALRQKVDEICQAELARTLPRLPSLTDQEKKGVEMMVAAIAAKVLHDPLAYLKSESCGGRDTSETKIGVIRDLFNLSDGVE